MVKVLVKWGKKSFDVELDTSGSPADFKALLLSLTGVPVARQKLAARGVWKGTLKDSADLSTMTFKDGQKIMLMGASDGIPEKKDNIVFIENMTKSEAAATGAVIPAGLVNLGNTCYMNATLQCLRYVPELREALTAAPRDTSDPRKMMVHALGALYNQLDASGDGVKPAVFVTLLRNTFAQFNETNEMGMHKQQDADELYSTVMQVMAGELKSPVKSVPTLDGESNVLDALFGIRFVSTSTCKESTEEAPIVRHEKARKLVCNIQGGAGAAVQINHMSEGIRHGLDGDVEFTSEKLGRNAVWSKKQRVNRLPKYLCVQFVRFFWKATPNSRDRAGVNCKILRPVTFQASDFDVYEFCTPALQKKLKVYRDKYAAEALEGLPGVAASASASASAAAAKSEDAKSEDAKSEDAKSEDAKPAAAADEDVDMDDDEAADLAAALALSTGGGAGGAGGGAGAADVDMTGTGTGSKDAEGHLGVGIPAEFRGLYELFAVVTHKGRSAQSGHYMGWARIHGDNWMCFDDDIVSPCKTENVMQLKGGGDRDMTYFVFYRAKE